MADFATWVGGLPINRRHLLLYTLCTSALVLDAVDIQVMALLAPAIGKAWGLTTELSTALFALTASGMFLGAAISGRLGDRIGRKPVLVFALALFSVATLGCALSPSPPYLLVSRFVTGIGLGAFITVNTAYLIEFLPTRQRGLLMGLWTIGLPLGNLAATGLVSAVLPVGGWRAIFLICAFAAIPLLLGMARLPESPVYLARKGHGDEARNAAAWLSGRLPPQFGDSPDVARQAGMSELFVGNRRRATLLVWCIWFAWNFAYFGTVLWMPTIVSAALPQLSPVVALAALAMAGITGRIAAAWMLTRLGRRYTIICSAAGASVAAIILGLSESPTIWLVAIVALGFFQDGGASAIVTWTPELYPTKLRATGVGFANAAGRAGAVAAPLVVGMLISASPKTAFFVFAAALLLAKGATVFLREETKDRQLDSEFS